MFVFYYSFIQFIFFTLTYILSLTNLSWSIPTYSLITEISVGVANIFRVFLLLFNII